MSLVESGASESKLRAYGMLDVQHTGTTFVALWDICEVKYFICPPQNVMMFIFVHFVDITLCVYISARFIPQMLYIVVWVENRGVG